jgi:hypothetical protein
VSDSRIIVYFNSCLLNSRRSGLNDFLFCSHSDFLLTFLKISLFSLFSRESKQIGSSPQQVRNQTEYMRLTREISHGKNGRKMHTASGWKGTFRHWKRKALENILAVEFSHFLSYLFSFPLFSLSLAAGTADCVLHKT